MAIAIREADIESDRLLLMDALFRYLTPLSDGPRFDWLYRSNPHGQVRAWIAMDRDRDVIVGSAAAFPRRLYVGHREEFVWVLGDFCINDQYRSLGPALQLQRACLSQVDLGTAAFCYDFPSPSMMAVYRRLHISPLAQMVRLAKPLRVDGKIREYFKTPFVARGLSAAGNLLLALIDRRPKESESVTIGLQQGSCGEEFSALARQVGRCYGVCVQRSAEYLNWRYLAHAYRRYELLTARRDGELLAYAFFSQSGDDATLADLFGVQDPTVISALVRRLVVLLRERGMMSVSAPMIESHPWIPLLRSQGFIVREAKPMIVYPTRTSGYGAMSWFFMHGDRDS
jgi:hypothetical protein